QGTDTAYLLLYLDDIVLTASFETLLQQIIASLHQEFCMTNLGSLNYTPIYFLSGGRKQGSNNLAEAEYCGVANAVDETCWLRNLLLELHTPLSSATLVYCDNVSFVFLSSNSVQHQCTKHIEIDIHFIRDLVTAGQVRVLHVPSRYQYANIFTKGFPLALFEEFRTSLSVRCPPAQTVGEC
ncbi:ribonuclease H-like domain-containing protein, partial [Tanacetum coccineum]